MAGFNTARKAHPLRRLLRYSRRYRKQIRLASLCSVLNKLFDLAPPALIGLAVDVVVQQQDSLIAQWGIESVRSQFIALTILTVIVWSLESICEYAYDVLWRNLAQSVQKDLRIDAYSHLQDLDLAFFEERSTGQLMAVLNDDINQLERFLDRGANEVLQVITTVVIIGGAFFVLAPKVAWLAMLPMPFIIWGAIAFQRLLGPRYADVRERVSLLNSRLSNNLSGIMTIKSFTAEDYEISRIQEESEAYRFSNRRAIALSALFIPLIRIFILVGFTATLLYGGLETVAGNMAVGTYSVLVFLTQRLLWPLTRLGGNSGSVSAGDGLDQSGDELAGYAHHSASWEPAVTRQPDAGRNCFRRYYLRLHRPHPGGRTSHPQGACRTNHCHRRLYGIREKYPGEVAAASLRNPPGAHYAGRR
jgi:ATP-binding cassette subfamily B protein